MQFSLLFIENSCIVPYGTERPCDDISSTSTEVMADNNCNSSNIGIFTGIIITLVVMLILMGLALVIITFKIAQRRKKQTQQLQ